jgi:hypothetical protein
MHVCTYVCVCVCVYVYMYISGGLKKATGASFSVIVQIGVVDSCA